MKFEPKPIDRLAGVDATILRLQQMEDWTRSLRATAPIAVARLGDLTRRMRPTAIGFLVELTAEEWEGIAIEHQVRFSGMSAEGWPNHLARRIVTEWPEARNGGSGSTVPACARRARPGSGRTRPYDKGCNLCRPGITPAKSDTNVLSI